MALAAHNAPDIVTCVYCGIETQSYQTISQIPSEKCKQEFVKTQLLGLDETPMDDNDYICLDHEECFRIKSLQFDRGLPFTKRFSRQSIPEVFETSICVLCSCTDASRFHLVDRMKTMLKNFVINELQVDGKKTTRKGTGITEEDKICHSCYETTRKKLILSYYSPMKKRPKQGCTSTSSKEKIDTDSLTVGTSMGNQIEIDTNPNKKICAFCGRENRDGGGKIWKKMTNLEKGWVEFVKKVSKSQVSVKMRDIDITDWIHKTGRNQKSCLANLKKEVRTLSKCVICAKDLKTANSIQEVCSDMIKSVDEWIEKNDIAEGNSYKLEIHKECFSRVQNEITNIMERDSSENENVNYENMAENDENLGTPDPEPINEPNDELFDRDKLIGDLLEETLFNLMKDEIPAHFPSAAKSVEDAFCDLTSDLEHDVENISRNEIERALDMFLSKNDDFKVEKSTKKLGRLVYSVKWNMVLNLYLQSQKNESYNLDASGSRPHIRTDEMFHSVSEIRRRVIESSKLCDSYGKYPELLQSIKLEDLLFTGVVVKFGNSGESEFIPPVDPLLFNLCYYIFCSDSEARVFENSFDPTWGKVYTEGYTEETRELYCRALAFVFDLLHQNNKNNVYPLHILISDLIANTKPMKLMSLLNFHRKCASSRKYDEYRSTIGENIKRSKSDGKILGLNPKLFTVIHVDNLEQYAKYSRDPSAALTSSLVIGAQQPLPKDPAMELKEPLDLRPMLMEDIFLMGSSDEEVDLQSFPPDPPENTDDDLPPEDRSPAVDSPLPYSSVSRSPEHSQEDRECEELGYSQEEDDSEEILSSQSQCSQEEDGSDEILSSQSQCSQEEDSSDEILSSQSQCSQEEDSSGEIFSSQESTSSVAVVHKPITRSSSGAKKLEEDPVLPRETTMSVEPRAKRLKLTFDSEHSNIGTYTSTTAAPEKRTCKLNDFIMTEKDKKSIEHLNSDVLVHALLQATGRSDDGDGDCKQIVPLFKEIMAWEQPIVQKTDTVYLELIPGKPDTIDTLLYALGIIKELFIGKLGFQHVMVCGDGKSVNLLYTIKDDYGNEMEWLLIMLGTWHLIKTYLGVFLKKYENVFVRKFLSFLSKGNVDAIIACGKWWKSHNFSVWMVSAVIRENINAFVERLKSTDGMIGEEILSQAKKTVNTLQSDEKTTQKQIDEFLNEQGKLRLLFGQVKDQYQEYNKSGYSNDDQFALFINVLDDFQAYYAMYISIRSSNWELRISALKMMATRFVRSGSHLYKWLVLRHLADITCYPENIRSRLEAGAWVSALLDGKGVTLARDEYHERTASKDIQLIMPKQLTKKNMQVVTQYATYGAGARRNYLNQFYPQRKKNFCLSKGCTSSWVDAQEKKISLFQKLLSTEEPFSIKSRLLHQPFTSNEAKEGARRNILGRSKLGEPHKDFGDETVKSYVLARFCRPLHDVTAEKIPMQKKVLVLFPSPKEKRDTRKQKALKEKEDVVNVLAAGLVKLSSEGWKSSIEIQNLQVSNAPGLFANSEDSPYHLDTKSDLRAMLEEQYSAAFVKPKTIPESTTLIRDGMQDIMVAPLRSHVNFSDYFNLFWNTKVRPNFSAFSTIIIDFDRQRRNELAPKDLLRYDRDTGRNKTKKKGAKLKKPMETISIGDEEATPGVDWTWIEFLANRENKARLVLYLGEKLSVASRLLRDNEVLYVSFEDQLVKVTKNGTTNLPFVNNHDESDTRIFWLCALSENDVVIRSTDTDILAIALLNHHHLELHNRNIIINYSSSYTRPTHCHLNSLVDHIAENHNYTLLQIRGISAAKLIGAMHFVTGCDDLSFLRGFSKNFCFTIFTRYCGTICGETSELVDRMIIGDVDATAEIFSKIITCLYCQKFSPCFSPGDLDKLCAEKREDAFTCIRECTWYKAIVSNNQLPTTSAILMHCKRVACVLKLNSSATLSELDKSVYTDSGWKKISKDGIDMLAPIWDTDDSNNRINQIRQTFLKKCGCAKSRCLTKRCSCKKSGEGGGDGFCTKLCTCNDCANRKGEQQTTENLEEDMEDEDGNEEDDEEEEDERIEEDDDYNEVSDDIDLQEMMDLMSDDDEEDEEDEEEENYFVDYLLA